MIDRSLDKDNIQIDPETFAASVVSGDIRRAEEDELTYIKRQMRLYLGAIYRAQDFNTVAKETNKKLRNEQLNRLLGKLVERRY